MYILTCADGSYYVGSTWDLDLRIVQHNSGFAAKYTASRRPVALAFYEEYERIDDAFLREKQVQNWSHAKRAALIRGDFDELRRLSRAKG